MVHTKAIAILLPLQPISVEVFRWILERNRSSLDRFDDTLSGTMLIETKIIHFSVLPINQHVEQFLLTNFRLFIWYAAGDGMCN